MVHDLYPSMILTTSKPKYPDTCDSILWYDIYKDYDTYMIFLYFWTTSTILYLSIAIVFLSPSIFHGNNL